MPRAITLRERLAMALLRPTLRKQDASMQAVLSVGPTQARWMQGGYDAYATEGMGTNPYVYACIRQISMAVAGIPWKAYSDASKKREQPNHPVLDLLHRPNPRQAQGVFFENMIGYLMLDGNNYISRAGSPTGAPDELYCLRPDRMRVIPGTVADPISGYVYRVGSVEVPYPEPMVLHQKFFNPTNDWYGLSPMQAASRSVDQSNLSKSWNVSLLQNGARPTGAMTSPVAVDAEQYARLQAMIEEQYAGMTNAGRPLLLEGGLTWQEMGMSPADMMWLEGQKLSAREIAMVYNIAPELIGDPDSKTFSNYQEARKALYQENVLPLLDWTRDDLNHWLLPLYAGGGYLDYDRNGIEALSEDRDSVYTRNNGAFAAGWITVDDARDAAQLPKDPAYGEFYKWQLPTSAASDPLAPPPEPPPPPAVLALPAGAPGAAPALASGNSASGSAEGAADDAAKGPNNGVDSPVADGSAGSGAAASGAATSKSAVAAGVTGYFSGSNGASAYSGVRDPAPATATHWITEITDFIAQTMPPYDPGNGDGNGNGTGDA